MGSGLALHSLRLRRQRWEDKEKTRGRVAAAAQGERGAYQSEHAFGNGAVCKRVEASKSQFRAVCTITPCLAFRKVPLHKRGT